MYRQLCIALAMCLGLDSIHAESGAIFEPMTEGTIRVENIAKKYDIALGFGDMGSYSVLEAGTGGTAEFSITNDREDKENEYITLNLKVYDRMSAGDSRRKVLERKSVRLYAPLGTFGYLNSLDNTLHLDYDKHSKNGTNAGKFKIKFKPDNFNKKITKIEQLFSANV